VAFAAASPPPIDRSGGVRTQLEQAGLKVVFSYYGDALGHPPSGVNQSLGYDGRFGQIVDVDLGKLAGRSGATFNDSFTKSSARNSAPTIYGASPR
jgi:carbohydrate-selective porin OprB